MPLAVLAQHQRAGVRRQCQELRIQRTQRLRIDYVGKRRHHHLPSRDVHQRRSPFLQRVVHALALRVDWRSIHGVGDALRQDVLHALHGIGERRRRRGAGNGPRTHRRRFTTDTIRHVQGHPRVHTQQRVDGAYITRIEFSQPAHGSDHLGARQAEARTLDHGKARCSAGEHRRASKDIANRHRKHGNTRRARRNQFAQCAGQGHLGRIRFMQTDPARGEQQQDGGGTGPRFTQQGREPFAMPLAHAAGEKGGVLRRNEKVLAVDREARADDAVIIACCDAIARQVGTGARRGQPGSVAIVRDGRQPVSRRTLALIHRESPFVE